MLTTNFDRADKTQTSVTVRMDRRTYKALRTYMHTAKGDNVVFPQGVKLVYRSMGWYKLVVDTTATKVHDKLGFAVKVMRRFLGDMERAAAVPVMALTHVDVLADSTAVWPFPRPASVVSATGVTN